MCSFTRWMALWLSWMALWLSWMALWRCWMALRHFLMALWPRWMALRQSLNGTLTSLNGTQGLEYQERLLEVMKMSDQDDAAKLDALAQVLGKKPFHVLALLLCPVFKVWCQTFKNPRPTIPPLVSISCCLDWLNIDIPVRTRDV